MDESIVERIREAQESSLNKLDLSSHLSGDYGRLTTIPDEVFELTHLRVLNLGGQRITRIPKQIIRLSQLQELILTGNEVVELPTEVAQLSNLENLDIAGSSLNSLPSWIQELPSLRYFTFGGSKLQIVPDWISNLDKLRGLGLINCDLSKTSIAKMHWLEGLNIGGSNLTELPAWVYQMINLKSLNISANRLTTLSSKIEQLNSLESLEIWVNRVYQLPNNIGELRNLVALNLAGNLLSALPQSFRNLRNLKRLDLGNNRFTTIPGCLYEMTTLESLRFSNADSWGWDYELARGDFESKNSIKEISPELLRLTNLHAFTIGHDCEIPPPEVVKAGFEAIKDYLRQIQTEGVDYLFEAKLIILGEGGAGKTTLAKKIRDPKYELEDERSTQGIDVIRWSFILDNGTEFKVNIWDFGGQEIYHATHQFFLTKRSLYVLVADTRKEDTDFYYWLNILELLSDNSPVVIVKNEKQNRHREISERQLRGQFDALKETLATNLSTNRGLQEIVKSIKYYISNLQHVGKPLPKTWVKVREVLELHQSNYISLEEYIKICEDKGFSDLKDKLQLSGYLHDLGVCLHFQEDPLLRSIVILKPKWGTDGVYKILDNQRIIAALGHFTRSDLADIWREPEYKNMHQELLRLMINFKLCYEIPGSPGSYIAPQLLTENQPQYQWDTTENLISKYSYEFLPKGIISQFIVAMHPWIENRDVVWKSGVILRKDDTRAEVIEYYGKRELQVKITGKHKRDLMAVVAHELDKIHGSYRQLQYNKLVPCNCESCRQSLQPMFFPLETLRKFAGDKQRQIQCQASYRMVEVRSLLDDAADSRIVSKEVGLGNVVFNAPIDTLVIQHTEDGGVQNTEIRSVNMEPKAVPRIGSAWANGLFYLFTFVAVITGIGYIAGHLPLYTLAVVVVAGILFVLLIGILQLKQDEKLSEKTFGELARLVVQQLPIIGKLVKSSDNVD